MAKNKNIVVVSGNFGRDPIMATTGDGTPVMNVTLANHKTRDKEKQPVWMKLTIWGKYATALKDHVQSGRKAFITGKLRGAEAYLDQAGKDKVLEILKKANSYGDNLKQLFIDLTNCFTAVPVIDVDDLEFGGYDKKDGENAETTQAPSTDIGQLQSQLASLMSAVEGLQKGEAEAEKKAF